MPIRDDLVQRTIEALGSALARLLARQPAATAVDEVRGLLERAYQAHFGVSGGTIRRLPSEGLLAVIASTGAVDPDRAYLTGALLELDAATPGHDVEEAAHLQLRALDLYCAAGAARVGEVDLPERVRRLRAALDERLLPEATYGRVLQFFMAEGQYAVAEDLLFEWLEAHGPTPLLRSTGEGLYDALEGVDDAALAAGDLPRSELPEGRATFRRSCAG